MSRTRESVFAHGRRAQPLRRLALALAPALLLSVAALPTADSRQSVAEEPGDEAVAAPRMVSIAECAYENDRDSYRYALRRHMEDASRRTEGFVRREARAGGGAADPAPAGLSAVPVRNFIDEMIFDRMRRDDVPHAELADDADFMRRASLDLTGRIPSATEARAFLEDDDPSKRDAWIDRLLASDAFVDKWTMFYGDLLRNTRVDSFVNRYPQGRNAFHAFIRDAVESRMPYDVFVQRLITAEGENSFETGAINWIVGGRTPMGPIQDTYDTLAVRASTQFLGLASVDCILCHDGAGHLEKLNLYATGMKRSEAWELSAFFSRMRIQRPGRRLDPPQFHYAVREVRVGDYRLNTTAGNRTPRQSAGDDDVVKPRYPFAAIEESGSSYRDILAASIVRDRQFARAAVNYLWRELMGMGIVEPADQFDLLRLEASQQIPEGWTVQPSHPALLEALADEFIASGYDLRRILGLIAESSAYQLSSRFPDEWRVEYTPYFARKLVRRLWAEEVHDALASATGVLGNLRVTGFTERLDWAMQLPDTEEPRRMRPVRDFLDFFLRGDRDTVLRSGDATIQQALNMMNNRLVLERLRSGNANTTVGRLIASGLDEDEIIDELFLATLSRFPTHGERNTARETLAAGRAEGAEDLQWALLNKIDFLYNH